MAIRAHEVIKKEYGEVLFNTNDVALLNLFSRDLEFGILNSGTSGEISISENELTFAQSVLKEYECDIEERRRLEGLLAKMLERAKANDGYLLMDLF